MARSRTSWRWKACSLWFFIPFASCFGGETNLPLGSVCDEDGDCGGDLVCQYGRCRSECDFDHECPNGTFCVAVVDNPDVRVCTLVDERCDDSGNTCPNGLRCVDGVCLNPCDPGVEESCSEGRQCIDDVCIEVENTEGEFVVRSVQIVHSWNAMDPMSSVTGASAPVRWQHVTFSGFVSHARESREDGARATEQPISEISRTIADTMLLDARGNSGVIIWT